MAKIQTLPAVEDLEDEPRKRGYAEKAPLLATAMHLAYERGARDGRRVCPERFRRPEQAWPVDSAGRRGSHR